MSNEVHVVTGAFGYTGRYIAQRLLDAGMTLRTLTHSPGRENPFGGRIDVRPFSFDDRARLVDSLRGAAVLYNTYWIRFNHRRFRQAPAVTNTLKLFDAAREAGVGKVVHVSITNPSEDSPLEYFRGKAALERALIESGLSYAILRPAVLFGREDILVNNIAYLLRRAPFFAVFGRGDYSLQPIHVDDFADLAVRAAGADGNAVIDAIGPQTFTFRDLVRQIGAIIGKPRPIISAPPAFGYAVGVLAGRLVGDVIITREEIRGLMEGLLCTDSPPAGRTNLTDWACRHRDTLGVRYASELARRANRLTAYDRL
ncbi:MAG: NAD-dependent epimerase/dehydratase family protein [Phycisphaerales bacterium]|nr:MAG: NAD-dependent epimerase/dehydratase family protein [Phycisphaerales bacterium]